MSFHHDPRGPTAGHRVAPDRPPTPGAAWVDETLTVIRPSLKITACADATRIADMRREFVAWLTLDVDTDDLLDDIVLAVYEALANAAEHAYASTPDRVGPVHLLAHRSFDAVRITVSDHGHWRHRQPEPFRNRGLGFIHALMAQVHVACDASGTAVHLRTRLPPPATTDSSSHRVEP